MCGFHTGPTDNWFIPFYISHFGLLYLQSLSVKGTVVVTLKVSSPLSLHIPLSPRTAAPHLSFWMAKMSSDDKPMPVAHRVASNN